MGTTLLACAELGEHAGKHLENTLENTLAAREGLGKHYREQCCKFDMGNTTRTPFGLETNGTWSSISPVPDSTFFIFGIFQALLILQLRTCVSDHGFVFYYASFGRR